MRKRSKNSVDQGGAQRRSELAVHLELGMKEEALGCARALLESPTVGWWLSFASAALLQIEKIKKSGHDENAIMLPKNRDVCLAEAERELKKYQKALGRARSSFASSSAMV